MCREGAWVELTIEVTSVECGTTHTARIFLYYFLEIPTDCMLLNTKRNSVRIKIANKVRSETYERIRIT